MDPPPLPAPPVVPPTTTSAPIANPTPPTLNHDHPPYAEMICAAITALRERDGSSKRAIAKYIEESYTNLPPNHSALLAHHLKRLKNAGLLVMVKKSYKLLPISDSDAPPAPILPTKNVVINNNSTTAATPTARGRGRPRKSKMGLVAAVDKPKRGRGRPRKTDGPIQQRGPIKRRPGRPRKPKTVKGRQVLQQQAQAQDQPNYVTVSYVTSGANMHAPLPVQVPIPGGARPRGRPKKVGTIVDAGGKWQGRGQGRPPENLQSSTGRAVGRPKKNLSSALSQITEAQAQTIADLKRKLEFFQAKLKQVVTVLKSQITFESQISVGIQELEGLASMDINIPLEEDTQPPVL